MLKNYIAQRFWALRRWGNRSTKAGIVTNV